MPTPIVMPRLSDSMEEGTILNWLIEEGQMVKRGDKLVEIETDKATMVYESDSEGLLHILAQPGETVPLGEVIAELSQEEHKEGQQTDSEVVSQAISETEQVDDQDLQALIQEERKAAREAMAARDKRVVSEMTERTAASPYARKQATEQNIDLTTISGSGPGGRIVAADLVGAAKETGEARPTTRVERLVASRMEEGKRAPEFWASKAINLSTLSRLREEMKEQGQKPPSINDLIMLAAARAAHQNPRLNSTWAGEEIIFHPTVNLGMAVAVDDGLIVPVIKGAEALSLNDISDQARRLAEAVRDGSITPSEMEGATMTVSSLGSMGVDRFQAILPPEQSAILAVGALRDETAWRGDTAYPVQVIELTVTVDHRTVYGAHAAQFLSDIATMLESPLRLI